MDLTFKKNFVYQIGFFPIPETFNLVNEAMSHSLGILSSERACPIPSIACLVNGSICLPVDRTRCLVNGPHSRSLDFSTSTWARPILFFFLSDLTSICNPVGYDRLKRLYIQESSLASAPSFSMWALSCRA